MIVDRDITKEKLHGLIKHHGLELPDVLDAVIELNSMNPHDLEDLRTILNQQIDRKLAELAK